MTAAGWRCINSDLAVADHASGSRSCSRRPTCPSAAPTSTWRSRVAVLQRPTGSCPRRGAAGARPFIGELTLDGSLRCGARGAADDAGRGRAGGSPRSSCPSRRRDEAAMVPGIDGVRRPLAGPGRRRAHAARRCPRPPPVAPMSGSHAARRWRGRGAARRGRHGRRARPGRRPLRRWRWRPPVATTCCSAGPRASGKTTLAERIPGDPARPRRSRSRSSCTAVHSLAGALEPGDRLITRPPVLGRRTTTRGRPA